MFEIKLLVEDKNVVRTLRALNGLGGNLSIVPVDNAVMTTGKAKASVVREAGEGHTMYDVILNHLVTHRPSQINSHEMGNMAKARGHTGNAYHYPLTRLLKQRILTRGPKRDPGSKDPQVYNVNVSNLPRKE